MTKNPVLLQTLAVLLCGCSTPGLKTPSNASGWAAGFIDNDGDGYTGDNDCNDDDPTINPGADEQCNGVDDNCSGEVDEAGGDEWFLDSDGDGYGGDSLGESCDSPEEGAVQFSGDCADDDSSIHPGSSTRVDGRDSDCDGRKDWKVTIIAAVDDAGELCINDEVVGPTGGWTTGAVYEIWLSSGTNAIGIHGWDTGMVITAAIAHIEISGDRVWVTDGSWRYDPEPDQDGIGKLGWCGVGFDDSDWDLAKDIGPIGDPSNPWGDAPSLFPADSPARWIWDHFPVNLNTQYLRMEFDLP